jgi:hypothetical protein
MVMTPSPIEGSVSGRDGPALVAVPQGVLLLEGGPLWKRGAIGKLVMALLPVALATYVFTLLAGSSGSLLVLLGVLWLSPWLALSAGSKLPRTTSTCREVLRQRLLRWAARQRLRHTPVAARARLGAPGDAIRVRGRVLHDPGFVSASGRRNCVLACYAGLLGERGDFEGRAEVHAMPCFLLLVGADIVEVALDGARYLEYPRRAARRLSERTIAAGDEVEVLGHLAQAIDHDGSGGYRTPGLKLVLGGDARRPLILRRST